jgi:hypothetical protein
MTYKIDLSKNLIAGLIDGRREQNRQLESKAISKELESDATFQRLYWH